MSDTQTVIEKEVNEAVETTTAEVGTTTAEIEEAIERPYDLRKLQDDDLWPLLQLFRKLGIKDAIETFSKYKDSVKFNPASYATKEEAKKALDELQETMGAEIISELVDFVLSKMDTQKDSIYEFFAGVSGIPADDIKKMEFGTLPLMVYDSFNGVKNTAFFKVLFRLL